MFLDEHGHLVMSDPYDKLTDPYNYDLLTDGRRLKDLGSIDPIDLEVEDI